jgi:hypothetical protein
MSLTPQQLSGAELIFCVEFVWGSRTHRYATRAITLNSDNGYLDFAPTIIDFDFIESADILSVDVEANIVSMALVMQDVDLLQRWAAGDTIEGLSAEFFYVLTKYEIVQQTYEDRTILYRGQIQEPQFGDPDEIDGFVSFSIEAQPYDGNRLLMDSDKYIDTRFGDRDIDTADGKPYPIVFGIAGKDVKSSPSGSKNIFATPAFCTEKYPGSGGHAHFMIAGHPVSATSASIQDDKFDTDTLLIKTGNDGRGNLYSYIEADTFDNVAVPGTSVNGTSREWWVYLTGAGLVNPYRAEALTGAGDLSRWALSKSGQLVDDDAWSNLSPLLNQYSLAGYINDPAITAFDWLNGNVLPLLPIAIRMGANGIKPILIEMWALTHVTAVTSISVGQDEECEQVSAVETIRNTSDLINELTINFAKRGFDQSYTSQIRVTDIVNEDYDVKSDYSILSVNRYGKKPSTISTNYVYDRDTAIKIALDKVRAGCLPINQIQIATPVYLGWLQVGDVLDVTIERLYLTDHKMLIVSKQWTGSNWSFKLVFEQNPIQNQ